MAFKEDFDASQNRIGLTESLVLRFHDTLDLVPIALLIVAQDGTIALANPEAANLFGYCIAELIAMPIEQLVADRFRCESRDHGEGFRAIATALELDSDEKLYGLRKDGQEIPIEVRIKSIHHQGGELLLCTVCELASWERTQVQLKKSTIEMSEANADFQAFAHLAAHDLQEPLRKVVSSLQALVDDHGDTIVAEARQWMDHAADGAKRMQRLVTDLLMFSLFSSQSRPVQPVDPNEAVRVVLSNLELTIQASSAQIICHPLPMIIADEIQLKTLLQHLVENAIRFRGDIAPRIEIGVVAGAGVKSPAISSERSGNPSTDITFYVRDNAIGISPESFTRIFVVLQRLHSRHAYPGTGMGLALCKKIVERHGGRIWLESTPGQGSTFYFTWGSAASNLS